MSDENYLSLLSNYLNLYHQSMTACIESCGTDDMSFCIMFFIVFQDNLEASPQWRMMRDAVNMKVSTKPRSDSYLADFLEWWANDYGVNMSTDKHVSYHIALAL